MQNNSLFVKREDLIPYCFGGNKARKAFAFFSEIDREGSDCVVTYGSGSSNHCRIISNLCAQKSLPCIIISPAKSHLSSNSTISSLLGAQIIRTPLESVSNTIDEVMCDLQSKGCKPFFIPGGGHGNIGTQAYVDCYEEICSFESESGHFFDYIFFASGTGTTQAGLVCGQLSKGDCRSIVGLSIARKNPYGRDVVLESIREYLGERVSESAIQAATIFVDKYTGQGYAEDDDAIRGTIIDALMRYGLPLDPTYTGKAFHGMQQYLANGRIENKTILFIHTGGAPLFFDALSSLSSKQV